MIYRVLAKASVTGVLAGLVMTAPAFAASAPTLTGPASRVGFGPVTLSGTAAPGAVVALYETAYVFDDLQPADDWEHGGGPLTTTANSSGHWQLQRQLDSGFYFQVESGGMRSNKLTVRIQQSPNLTITSPSDGVVQAHIVADPAQPSLPAQLQMANGTSWTAIASGNISEAGTFDATVSSISGGTHQFRAYVGGDPSNAVLAGYSATYTVTMGGGSGTPNTPSSPATGVRFTGARYDSPGADTRTNSSLNGEYVRLTNRTSSTINLRGWTVRDAGNNTYTFTTSFKLGGGRSVYVRTGKGTNTTSTRYWGRASYVWNNSGDTASLRTASGATVDTCKWGKGTGYTAC